MKGIRLGTLLGVAFVVLKLCNVITWSWLWVLSPIWISILIDIIIIIIIIVCLWLQRRR